MNKTLNRWRTNIVRQFCGFIYNLTSSVHCDVCTCALLQLHMTHIEDMISYMCHSSSYLIFFLLYTSSRYFVLLIAPHHHFLDLTLFNQQPPLWLRSIFCVSHICFCWFYYIVSFWLSIYYTIHFFSLHVLATFLRSCHFLVRETQNHACFILLVANNFT